MVILGSAAVILPSCQPEAPAGPVYENIPLEPRQRAFLEQFAEALLPRQGTEVATPESTQDYILTILNDCHSQEDIQLYTTGLKELQAYLRENYGGDFGSLDAAKQAEVFSWLAATDRTEPVKFFAGVTRQLAIEHFTSSQYFLAQVMKWEFVPGRYLGCVPV